MYNVFWRDWMDNVILQPLKEANHIDSRKCGPCGGIGRRSRLKICHSQGCEGSIPFVGTRLNLKALTVLTFKAFFIFRGHYRGQQD